MRDIFYPGLFSASISSSLLLLASCTPGNSTIPGHLSRDSAGVEINEVRDQDWEKAAPWNVSSEPELTIGEIDGEDPFIFDGIVQVRRGGEGRVLVADAGSNEIRIFDSRGNHLASFGGTGRGPGEFLSIGGLLSQADTIWVWDGVQSRLSLFSEAGEFNGSIRLAPTGNLIHPLRMYGLRGVSSDGFILTARAFPADMRPKPVSYWDTIPTLRFSRDGSKADTVGEFCGLDTYSTPSRAGSVTFGRMSASFVADGLIYQTDGGEYEVRVFDPETGLRRVIRALRPARPVTQEMLDEYLPFRAGPSSDPGTDPARRRQARDWGHRETMPWVSALIVDEDRNLWIREYQPPLDPTPQRWGVIGSSGSWLGTVQMPDRFTPHQIVGGVMVGVTKGHLGVESVQAFRLSRE